MSEQHIVYPAPKKPRRWITVGIAAASLLVGYGIGASGDGADVAAPAPTSTVTVTAKPKPAKTVTAKPKPAKTVTAEAPAPEEKPTAQAPAPADDQGISEGTYQVGVDMKAGRYKTVVPGDSYGCYVERSSDDSGELDSVISNDLLEAGAHGSVTVKSGEFFKTTGCGDWELQK